MNKTIRKLHKSKRNLLFLALTFSFLISIIASYNIQESYGLDPLTQDLVGYWRLNESSGTNAEDLSGNGYNGTLVNMEDGDWVAGKLNNALGFDGVNEYVNLLDIADFERTQPFSVEAWIKTSQKGIIVSRQQWVIPYRGWYVGTNPTGRLQFLLTNTWGANQVAAYQDDVNMIDGTWHHFIITYDGSSSVVGVKFYVDGQLRTTKGVPGGLSATIRNGENCQINGASGLNENFAGIIDEVAIYDKELSSSEATERWNNGDGIELDFSIPNVETPNTSSITISSDVYFIQTTFNKEINFATQQTFSTIRFENGYWYFNQYGFCPEGANLTVTRYFQDDQLHFTSTGTGLTTTRIYVAEKGEPDNVQGASNWNYNSATRILTIYVSHSSPEEIAIDWDAFPPQIKALLNLFLILGILSVGLTFIEASRRKGKLDTRAIIILAVAFLLMAILVPQILINWGI